MIYALAGYLLANEAINRWFSKPEEPTLMELAEASTGPITQHLYQRARDRDYIFKQIEEIARANNYHRVINLAEKGWQLRGR